MGLRRRAKGVHASLEVAWWTSRPITATSARQGALARPADTTAGFRAPSGQVRLEAAGVHV